MTDEIFERFPVKDSQKTQCLTLYYILYAAAAALYLLFNLDKIIIYV